MTTQQNFWSDSSPSEVDEEIITEYIHDRYGLMIGEQIAEQVKLTSVQSLYEELVIEIRGIDIASGVPRSETCRTPQIRLMLP